MVLPFAHIKIEVYNMVDQSKYNNKHHMKSNSGTIFVLIGDRSNKGFTQPYNPRDHIYWMVFGYCRFIPQTLWKGCH